MKQGKGISLPPTHQVIRCKCPGGFSCVWAREFAVVRGLFMSSLARRWASISKIWAGESEGGKKVETMSSSSLWRSLLLVHFNP